MAAAKLPAGYTVRHVNVNRRVGTVNIYNKEGLIVASLNLVELPGCCGVGVLHGFHATRYTVERLIQEGRSIAHQAGYTAVVASTSNGPSRSGGSQEIVAKALGEDGWDEAIEFNNNRTHNDVTVWCRKL